MKRRRRSKKKELLFSGRREAKTPRPPLFDAAFFHQTASKNISASRISAREKIIAEDGWMGHLAVAEFERSIIQKRVKAGLKAAKAKGVTLGRPERLSEHVQIAGDQNIAVWPAFLHLKSWQVSQ